MRKYFTAFLGILFLSCKHEEFRVEQMPEGIFSISIPKEMKEFTPEKSFEDGLKFRKYFVMPDSTTVVDIGMHFKPTVDLKSRIAMEEGWLQIMNGGDYKPIKKEILEAPAEMLLITYTIPRPGSETDRYVANRVLFNTVKNLCVLNLYSCYKDDKQMEEGQKRLKRIVESIQIPDN